MKISERTKMELLVSLIFCLTLIWMSQAISNEYNEKKIEELKEEKTKLEIRNNKLFKIYEEVSFDPLETVSVDNYHSGARMDHYETKQCVDDVSADDSVEGQIREIAKEHNFKWTDFLIKLAMCESSLDINAKNVNKSGSVDRGVFQINDYWHKEVSDEQAYDLRFATEWTIKAINEGHQNWWTCDKIIKKNSLTALSK